MATTEKDIVWFDIDNTLYSASSNISQAMGERIHAYFMSLGLSDERASQLHLNYYTQYGLALAGLVRHHRVDPLDFDRKCDGSLPLEDMIKPNPEHRKLFEDIDRTKVRVWALTNAYKTHAERVLRILNLYDQVEGIVYCDYEQTDLVAKPEYTYYRKALEKAGVSDPSKCYFIDDNYKNVVAAKEIGWKHCIHFCESGMTHVEGGKARRIGNEVPMESENFPAISKLEEIRDVWPEIFKGN